jgi:hypothetical protein
MIRKGKHQALVVPLNITFKRWVENNIAGEVLADGAFHVQSELVNELEDKFHKEGFYGAD